MIILKNKYIPDSKKVMLTEKEMKKSFEFLKKLEYYKSIIFKDGEIQ